MADFLLRDIDERVADRIKEMARKKGWPLNDVILHLLKVSLGLAEPEAPPVPGDIARLSGAWGDEESKAFEAFPIFNNFRPQIVPNCPGVGRTQP